MSILLEQMQQLENFPCNKFCVNSSIKKHRIGEYCQFGKNLLTQYTLKLSVFEFNVWNLLFYFCYSFQFLLFQEIHKYKWFKSKSRNKIASSVLSVWFLINKIQDLDFEYVGNLYHILNTRSMLPTYMYTHIMCTFSLKLFIPSI